MRPLTNRFAPLNKYQPENNPVPAQAIPDAPGPPGENFLDVRVASRATHWAREGGAPIGQQYTLTFQYGAIKGLWGLKVPDQGLLVERLRGQVLHFASEMQDLTPCPDPMPARPAGAESAWPPGRTPRRPAGPAARRRIGNDAQALLRWRRAATPPTNARPASIIATAEGSGTAVTVRKPDCVKSADPNCVPIVAEFVRIESRWRMSGSRLSGSS